MSSIDDGVSVNPSDNEHFSDVLDAAVSRRSVLGGTAGLAALGLMGGAVATAVTACAPDPGGPPATTLLGFTGIPTSNADTVVVPAGYTAEVLIAWGDPVSNGPAFAQDGSNTSAEQAQQWGMHNDGIVYFPINGSRRGLIVQNHEYTDDHILFPDGVTGWNAEKTAKSQAAHGVGIIEVRTTGGGWQVVRPSLFARRITASTPMTITGPAAGHPLLHTAADPTGTAVLGTLNNCAMGFTPWGTYLACEENFNGYFRKTAARNALENRYGISSSSSYQWYTTDQRFDVDVTPNEPNRFGWVVEIDPFDPTSTPAKRTGLGRLKHEGAWVQETDDGHVVVYLGDDQANEYIYRFVSARPWQDAIDDGESPLDDGILYVARFSADGTGEWLPLDVSNPALSAFPTNADIMINTRAAADAVGATKMDRPEWIDTIPSRKEAYVTLTNNSGRGGAAPNPAVDAANPRPSNVYGHIVRWRYAVDFDEPTFTWDIFALGGDPTVPANGSTIVGDKYGSPDGIYAAPSSRLWIQTDVSSSTIDSGAYAGFGNNQMLCADPVTKETRRFLVGPKGCEITGVFETPDEKTMFVGIQHPGEAPSGNNNPANPKQYSSWPDGAAGGRPRSALLVITKDDGGVIGT
jgi:secreted PhoX family phosphatase